MANHVSENRSSQAEAHGVNELKNPNPGTAIVLRRRDTGKPLEATIAGNLCIQLDGFSLHAAVSIPSHRRDSLERSPVTLSAKPRHPERMRRISFVYIHGDPSLCSG